MTTKDSKPRPRKFKLTLIIPAHERINFDTIMEKGAEDFGLSWINANTATVNAADLYRIDVSNRDTKTLLAFLTLKILQAAVSTADRSAMQWGRVHILRLVKELSKREIPIPPDTSQLFDALLAHYDTMESAFESLRTVTADVQKLATMMNTMFETAPDDFEDSGSDFEPVDPDAQVSE